MNYTKIFDKKKKRFKIDRSFVCLWDKENLNKKKMYDKWQNQMKYILCRCFTYATENILFGLQNRQKEIFISVCELIEHNRIYYI